MLQVLFVFILSLLFSNSVADGTGPEKRCLTKCGTRECVTTLLGTVR